jgi:1-acyl-sn-glycerol-3-phosphate acyltransferase
MASRSLRRTLLGNPVVHTLLSVWAWILLGVLLLVWLPLMALVRLVTFRDPARYATGLLFRKVAVVHQKLNPLWRFRVSGEPITDPRRPYVVVANHQSFVDMLLVSHLPWEMKWLAKKDFFQYPVIGLMVRLSADVKLVRGNRDSVVAAMDSCRDRLSKRVSVMIFPEGTRSADGSLKPFKDGAFRLAIETGTPVLPLALNGTYDALHKGDWRFGVTEAEVRVLPAIETAGMTLDDLPALKQQARQAIIGGIDAIRTAAGLTPVVVHDDVEHVRTDTE